MKNGKGKRKATEDGKGNGKATENGKGKGKGKGNGTGKGVVEHTPRGHSSQSRVKATGCKGNGTSMGN